MKQTILCLLSIFLLQCNSKPKPIQIQYLANHGVLITSSDKQILIDGAFKKEFDYLDVLPDPELSKIENAQDNYSTIDVILTTHIHGDHFNAELNGNHLINNKKAKFIAPEETVTDFKEKFTDFDKIASRVTTVSINLYQSKIITLNGIEIKAIRLEHLGKSPWKEAESLIYLFTLDGKKIAHFGDAKLDEESLKNLNLTNEHIDVAIMSLWQLGPQQQKAIVDKYINPKQILAGHIPPSNYTKAQKSIDELGYKNVIALTEQLKTIIIE